MKYTKTHVKTACFTVISPTVMFNSQSAELMLNVLTYHHHGSEVNIYLRQCL